jgi:ubiquinone biosynthesis monooxygenase Coq7
MPKPFFEDKNKKLQEIIRVNHAGEFGAQKIYQGQIKYTKNPVDKRLLVHMLEQEEEHLDYFSDKIKTNSRPTIFMPIWNVGGYLMGAISAKLGIKAAMLVTENVETVIENHYQEQIEYLEQNDPANPMLAKIKKFKDDETEHKNIALESSDGEGFMSKIIQTICKSAIFLSKKL